MKAGRVISAANMKLLRQAKEALEALIAAETSRRQAKADADEEESEESEAEKASAGGGEPALECALTEAAAEKRSSFDTAQTS